MLKLWTETRFLEYCLFRLYCRLGWGHETLRLRSGQAQQDQETCVGRSL